MNKALYYVAALALSGVPLLAQSADNRPASRGLVTQTVKDLPLEKSLSAVLTAPVAPPPVVNVLTVIGDDSPGVPCLNCLLDTLVPSLGLPSPLGSILRGNSYQIDSYLIDNSYTGACTFTFAVRDSQNNLIAAARQTLDEEAGTEILLSTPITIPPTAGIGLGSVSNTAQCGSNTSESKSAVFIACVTNPPYCVD